MYSFPELVALRKFNKKGEEYSLSHVKKAIKDNHPVLFGAYPFDIDKKSVMMNMVNEVYPEIPWILDKNGELKKENYDACDSLICALAYVNINHHGLAPIDIVDSSIDDKSDPDNVIVEYSTSVWDRKYTKKMLLAKTKEEPGK